MSARRTGGTIVRSWAASACMASVILVGATPAAFVQAGPTPVPTPAPTIGADAVAAIARDLNCPVCEGYNLQECPLVVCAQMREVIRERLAAGQTRQQIVDGFVADYGPEVLNAPPTTGFYLAAWLVPIAVLAGGAALAAAGALRRARGGRAEGGRDPVVTGAQSAPDPAAPAYIERLERLVRGDE